MNASLSVVYYKSKTLSTGKHPLILQIHKNGKRKTISLGISVYAKDWDFTKNEPKPKEYTATSLAESKKKN